MLTEGQFRGRSARTIDVLDDDVRETLDIEIDASLPAPRNVRVLESLNAWDIPRRSDA